jgi:hypothetical protein
LRGFDLHLIPSTKELTCLIFVCFFQVLSLFFGFPQDFDTHTHKHKDIAITCTENPTFAMVL